MYRLVDCDTWADCWFEGLAPTGTLFFLYLLTNPRSTSCGAFEVTPRKMAFETGLEQADIEGYLREWVPRVMWWPDLNIVWVRNFFRRQGNQNDKTRINAARIVAGLPIPVQREIGKEYPELAPAEDRVSIPDPYPSHQTSNIQHTQHEQQHKATAAATRARAEPDLPVATVRVIGANGTASACAFAAAVGDETFTTIAENFVGVNPQLDRAWLARTLSRFEVEGLSLPPPATRHALKQAYLKAQDALGREGNRISHPQAWTARQIETALRDEARAVTA
jgi:hypothetical protein